MNYRLERIRKATPLKKTPQTDAIFANVNAVKAQMKTASVASVMAEVQPVAEAKVRTPPIPPTPATTEVKAVGAEVITASQTLEISMDTKAEVNEGDYARGGKKPGPAPTVRPPRDGIMTHRRNGSGRRWASWWCRRVH